MGEKTPGVSGVGLDLIIQDSELLWFGEIHTLPPNRVTPEPQG